jgi:hypothetical protein
MLGSSKPNVEVSAQDFAAFNEKLYFDSSIPSDKFLLPENVENAKITPAEIKQVLESHYPANRSTGLSNMPTQCIKWLGQKALPSIAAFLNKSAIE